MYTRRTLPAVLAVCPAIATLLGAARPAGAAAAAVQNLDGGQTVPAAGAAPGAAPWRSALYPTNWAPGFSDAQGRFLHDFSYAGYHRGEVPVPSRSGPLVDVTQAPYLADKTGNADATPQIQRALEDAGSLGGGVVYLPAGTYCVRPQGANSFALHLRYSNVVLRGAYRDGALPADFHMFLSMANLIDNATVDGDSLEAIYRPHGTVLHGQTTTQSVFWNTNGLRYPAEGPRYAVVSRQFGWGYVVGTRGPCSAASVPIESIAEQPDYKEGAGHGDPLIPASLYEDQLRRRRGR